MEKKITDFSDEVNRLRCERSAAGEAVEKRLGWVHGIIELCLALPGGAILLGVLSALGMKVNHWFPNVIYFLIFSIACWIIVQGAWLTKLTKRIALGMFGGYINRPLAQFAQQLSVSELTVFLREHYPAPIDIGADLEFRRSQHSSLGKIIGDKKTARNEALLKKVEPLQNQIKEIANKHHQETADNLAPLKNQLEREGEIINILEAFVQCNSDLPGLPRV